MKGKQIKVILNPDREDDRRIMDYLLYAGRSKSKAVKDAVLFYLDNSAYRNEGELFIQRVRDAVREELRGLNLAAALEISKNSSFVPDEDPVSPLEFLDELESGHL